MEGIPTQFRSACAIEIMITQQTLITIRAVLASCPEYHLRVPVQNEVSTEGNIIGDCLPTSLIEYILMGKHYNLEKEMATTPWCDASYTIKEPLHNFGLICSFWESIQSSEC